MICPRCKEKNSAQARVCQSCGLKLKTICPRCRAPNKLGQPKCTKCNLTLIRYCPQCKAPNFPNAKNCRKCSAQMRQKASAQEKLKVTEPQKTVTVEQVESNKPAKETDVEKIPKKTEQVEEISEIEVIQEATGQEIPPQEEPAPVDSATEPCIESANPDEEIQPADNHFKKELSRGEAAAFLQEIISGSDKGCLIGLCAPNGIGKSTITSSLTRNVKDKQIIWVVGHCEPAKNNIPYSFFKNLMCILFGISALSSDKEEIKKSIKKTFETNLEISDEKVLNIANRILLNEYKDCEDNIEASHNAVQQALQKIFLALEKKAPIVLIVEDFEFIDKASFDCIKYLLKNGFLGNKNFLIINHTNNTNLAEFFPEEISSKQFLLVLLKYLNNEELNKITLSMLNNENILPDELKYKIFRQSKGLPIYVEQALWYLFQVGAIYTDAHGLRFNPRFKDIEIPSDLLDLFGHRLEMIDRASFEAEKIIFASAVFGFKFIPGFIQAVTEIENQKMKEALDLLVNNGIFSVLDQQEFAFKHINLWQIVFEKVMREGKTGEISSKILSVLENNKVEPDSGFLARLAENTGDIENMTYYYSKAAQESFFLGDSLTYTENQIKLYERISSSKLTEEEKEAAKLNISEQIGKVNYELNPPTAVKYLSETMKRYEDEGNNVKLIELSGYLSKSYELMGNFIGVLECAEKAVSLTKKPESSLEVMLLGFPKIDAIFNLGRLQEAIVTLQDEILPSLNRAVSKNQAFPGLSIGDLEIIEYEAEYILAKALTFQGNKQAIEVLGRIAAKAEKENQQEYELKALLCRALFSLIQGNLNVCENILGNIEEKGFSVNQSNETMLQWFLISVLSDMMTANFEQARNLCYSALSLAVESRDYNLFSILKLLSGYFCQHFQYYKNAVTIYEETANYCSETKMATGALYAWYFAAEAELRTGNPDKAEEIADRALDVSQKPNINNFIITIILSRLLAEIKIIKGDLEGAQINIENVLNLAEDNELYYPLIELYITLGKIYQESASVKKEKSDYACNCAYKAYSKAYNLAEKIENEFILQKVVKTLSNLNTFCKLSGITLEK